MLYKKVLALLYAVAWIKNDAFFYREVSDVYVEEYKNGVLPNCEKIG